MIGHTKAGSPFIKCLKRCPEHFELCLSSHLYPRVGIGTIGRVSHFHHLKGQLNCVWREEKALDPGMEAYKRHMKYRGRSYPKSQYIPPPGTPEDWISDLWSKEEKDDDTPIEVEWIEPKQ